MPLRINAFITIIIFSVSLGISSKLFADSTNQLPVLQIVTEGLKPVSYIDPETGKMAGFASEYLQDILALTDIEYQFSVYPWTRTYKIGQMFLSF